MRGTLAATSAIALVMSVASEKAMAQASPKQASTKKQDQLATVPPSAEPEIVVTAQRREERLKDVPISVSVTTGTALQNANISKISDLATRLPNVRVADAGIQGNLINIRGVGSGENVGFEQSVATFVDGVYRSRSRSLNAALFDVERVEVLKGPQTTYFGNNAIAGAFNITTRKPGNEFAADAIALYAPAFHEYDLEGGVTLPASPELGFRIAAKAFGQNGWVRNIALNRDEPRARNFVTRGSIRWQPSSNWRTDIRVDYGHLKQRGFGEQILNCPPPPPFPVAGLCAISLAADPTYEDKLDRFSNSISRSPGFNYHYVEAAGTNQFDVGGFHVTSITSYFHHNYHSHPYTLPSPAVGLGGGGLVEANASERYNSFSQELRVDSERGKFFEYTLGGYYQHSSLDSELILGFYFAPFGFFAPDATPTTPVALYLPFREKSTTKSGFAAGTFNFTDKLKLNLGVRYSDVEKTGHSFDQFGSGGVPLDLSNFTPFPSPISQAVLSAILGADPNDFGKPHASFHKLMPSANVQYKFSPNLMAYLSYANGFKAGGFSAGFKRDTFQPETVDDFEAGLKGDLLSGRMSFAVALFDSRYSNLQTQIATNFGGIPAITVTNAGKSTSKGVEFSATVRANRWISLHTDVAYLDARYSKYPNAPCTQLQAFLAGGACIQDMSGRPRAYAPKWSGNAGLNITAPLARNVELRVDPNVYFTSKFYESANADPLLVQPGYAKVDMRVAVGPADRRWELAVIGKNLTNKITATYRNLAGGQEGLASALIDPPRQIALQASVRF